MAIGNLDSIAQRLIENGMREDMPTAVIADVTLPTQRIVRASLQQISKKCREKKFEPPAVVIIGAAADSDARFNWFTKRPLFGKNIVVTRDAQGNADFAAKIICRGGNPIEFATMQLKPLTQTNQFLQALTKLAEYDWIIFTSANGVAIFLDCLQSSQKDARAFGYAKIAAIGSETSAKLDAFGIKADFVPSIFTSRELGKQLVGFTNLQDKKILLLRSQLASAELIELLEHAGAEVENVAVYTAVEQKSEGNWLAERIKKGWVHWLTFASPFSVRIFFEQVPSETVNSGNVKVASIGPVTSELLKSLGVRVDMEAPEHTIEGLLNSIEQTYK
jgi:uroporphyrinogen III methyltransferase/synthase